MIQPTHYYCSCDTLAKSLSDVSRYVEAVEEYAGENGYRAYWRGQANHEWGLVSSLARLLVAQRRLDDTLLNRVEDSLLEEASSWIRELGDPPYSHPLAKLAFLQHHGVPTRLLDFTSSPWMAVFFATEAYDDIDGRVFAILVEQDAVLSTTPTDKPWRGYKSDEILVYNPTAAGVSFPRLVAQEGVFALGRLPSTRPHRKAYDEVLGEDRSLLAAEMRSIMSIPFKLSRFDPTAGSSCVPDRVKPPIGLTFRIHVNKPSVRRDLEGVALGRKISPPDKQITHKTVYPDANGMVAYSETLAGLKQGLLILSD